jgi:hypothetical protein
VQLHLIYRGHLPSNGDAKEKQRIRRAFHPQLRELWQHPPLSSHPGWLDPNEPKNLVHQVGGFNLVALVCDELRVLAELDIVMLRPAKIGGLIRQGGDIDNRLKTLFDALRRPNAQEIPSGDQPGPGEDPFFCLLDDDERIERLNVRVDRFLAAPDSKSVVVTMMVQTRVMYGTLDNLSLG